MRTMYQAHRHTRPSGLSIALRVAGHFVAAVFTLIVLWGALVAFLLVASAAAA